MLVLTSYSIHYTKLYEVDTSSSTTAASDGTDNAAAETDSTTQQNDPYEITFLYPGDAATDMDVRNNFV